MQITMKQRTYTYLLALLAFVATLTGCTRMEEIVFDHELPKFELRDDAILLELIVPQGTQPDEKLYIVGDFNGGQEAAMQSGKWQLEKAPDTNDKWGIYLFPGDFVPGKSLADGFYFVSEEHGAERTLKDEEMLHKLDAKTGNRYDLTSYRWASYFIVPEEPEEIVHDGYVIYVINNTGWESTALYAWGNDLPELFGGWPGVVSTETETKEGQTYIYYDTGKDNKGLTYNLIFNPNGGEGNQLPDFEVTLDRDYYLELTEDGVVELNALEPQIKHDGFAIFIDDQTTWGAMALYGWFDGEPELFGGWPGMATPTGQQTIDGVIYNYYDTGEANIGKSSNLILNNNNGGKQYDVTQLTMNRHYYFRATDDGAEELEAPQ